MRKNAMQFNKFSQIVCVALLSLVFLGLAGELPAQDNQPVAELIALTGRAEIKAAAEAAFRPAQLQDRLSAPDTIRTLAEARAKLLFQDESVVILNEKTTLEISRYLFDEKAGRRDSLLKTAGGKLRFIVHKFFGAPQPDFTLETETLVVGVRGTDGILESFQQDTVYLLEAGAPLQLKNKFTGQVMDLSPMHFVVAAKDKPFQVNVITPQIYERLIKEYRLSYDFEPKNLAAPEPPSKPQLLGADADKTRLTQPPVTQPPLPTLHMSPSGRPGPTPHPPYMPPGE